MHCLKSQAGAHNHLFGLRWLWALSGAHKYNHFKGSFWLQPSLVWGQPLTTLGLDWAAFRRHTKDGYGTP